MTCGGSLHSGDVRTWKSLLTHAYKGVAGMEGDAQAMLNDYSKITTAKDQLLAKDKTMYDNKSGHLNKKARH